MGNEKICRGKELKAEEKYLRPAKCFLFCHIVSNPLFITTIWLFADDVMHGDGCDDDDEMHDTLCEI